MRKFYLLSTLVLTTLLGTNSFAQDFSNKGKDFWLGYGYHQIMSGTNNQEMVLYFATDQVTTVTVSIPGTGYSVTYPNIPANTVFTSNPLPKSGAQDARLTAQQLYSRGVHIVADKAVVAYAHIFTTSVSGATILFPTSTLGKEYYSINYTNISNSANSNCWFYVVAADTGTTTVEITPSANTTGGWIAGNTYTVTMTQGEIYNVMGTFNNAPPAPANGVDLSGSVIKSVSSSGGGCKRIGVFSGSGRISITCNGASSSSDYYMTQAFPKTAWGKKYLTVPTGGSMSNNIYRVCVSDPSTAVTLNGAPIPYPLINNFYYQIPATAAPNLIQADKPICVAQYITSQNACGNGSPGDPEVIYLSSVEQNIAKVIFNSTPNTVPNITQHFYNVVIPNTGTAITSFTLDGNPVPAASFQVHPQDPNFSYLVQAVVAGQHIIQSDSGFNGIAYGYGGAESYGYNAGTNIRDLFQFISIKNQHGTVNFPATCRGTPFKFSMTFPYQPIEIRWEFGAVLNGMGINDTIIYNGGLPIVEDSSWVVAGRTLYQYRLPRTYFINAVGLYPIKVTATNPTPDGCGGVQEIDFDVQVFEPPIADFNFVTDGCVINPVSFTDNSNTAGRPIISRHWNFGDASTSALPAPTHTYAASGIYNVKYTVITDIGCIADTVTHPVTLDDLPIANFSASSPICINQPVTFTDASTTSGTAVISEWTWDFGDGSPIVIASTNAAQVHTYSTAGNYNVTLVVETSTGCPSTVFTLPITVLADATVTLSSAAGTDNQTVCINTPITNITYLVGGSGTGGTVTGLPAGVTGSFAGAVITISGTPTVSGTFNYTVSTTGPCLTPTTTGTITISPDATVNLTSATGSDNQTVCINTPITDITYAVGTGGTGGTVTGLPAGVSGTFSGGVITISGTPTVSGTFNYTATATGPCAGASATGTITVTPAGTVSLTSAAGSDNQTVCINTPIAGITYAIGGSSTGGSVTGLPAGVIGTFAGGVISISGTPTISGIFNYTVIPAGPCATTNATGTITVTDDATITLTSPAGTDNQTGCINNPIIPITYAVSGSGTGGTVTGLPAGVTGTFAGGVLTIAGSPTVNGVFNYTVTTTGPCGTPTTTGTITVTPNATVTLTSAPGTDNQSVCINTPITVITYSAGGSATGGSVTGLPPGVTGTFAGGIVTISGTPTSAAGNPYNYTVSTTGPCGTPTATGTITVTDDATITLTSAPPTTSQELCFNTPIVDITYAIAGSGTGATVAGLPAGVNGSFAGGVFTISGTATASGVFNYTVTTAGPCAQAIASGTITINALPTSNFNFTAPSCETRVISFTDISTPNSGVITTWAWDFGDPPSGANNISNLQNPSHTYTSSGTYNVTLVVTTDKGCVSTQPSRQVVINARPLAGYILPEVCLNDTFAQFTDTSKVAIPDNIVAWAWNFGDPPSGVNNISNLQNPQHAYTATGTYLVELIATSNRGCKDTVTQTLFVNGSFPTADFTVINPATLCANDSVSIVEASTVFPGTITKVEIYWDNIGQPAVFVTDNSPVTGKVYKHLYPNLQTTVNYQIRYRAYSGGVCVNDKLSMVTVNAAPLVQFNNMPNACLNAAPFQITQASETGGVPGTGVFSGPGVTPGGIFDPASVGPGTYTILYTFTSSAAGCVDTMSNSITVLEPPIADFGTAAPFCETKAITFTDNSNTPVGLLTTWTWDFGDGSPIVVRNNASAFTHTFAAFGVYQVKLTVTTSDGCVSVQKVIPVTVNPQPKPNFSTPSSACLPDANVSFGNLSTIADGSQGSFSYLWNFGDPGSGANNSSTQASPTHIYTSTGPFSVNLQVTSNNGCVHDTTILLNTLHPEPLASFTVDKTDVCLGGSFNFNNTSDPLDGTTTQINWVMDDGNVRNTPSFTYTYATPGTYNVSLFIFNSHGCRSTTANRTVFVNPFPVANAGPDKFMLEGGQVTLTPTLVTNMQVSYLWSPIQYLSDPAIANTIASPPVDKTYTLTVTSSKGCSRSDDVFIKILKAPAIPNIFSPNGDAVHDKWVIQYLETYPGATVDIFNRYGQLIFHSEGYTTPWDGTVKGNPVPVGTYYYIVNPKNGRKIMSGYVDVIR